MTLSLQEISDRMEIQDLLVEYSYAIDQRDWDALDRVFTPDAFIDFTETGGARGGLGEIKKFLASALVHFASSQHLVATSQITIDGDAAEGRTICHNPMILDGKSGGPAQIWFVGLWYLDRFVRTPAGWRIRERRQKRSYMCQLPAAPDRK